MGVKRNYRRPTEGALLMAIVTWILFGIASWVIWFRFLPPDPVTSRYGTYAFPKLWQTQAVIAYLCNMVPIIGDHLNEIVAGASAPLWPALQGSLQQYAFITPVMFRLHFLTRGSLLAAVVVFVAWLSQTPKVRTDARHIKGRGRVLRDGPDAWKYADKLFESGRRFKKNGEGIYIAPGVRLDFNREREGILVIGAPRSGKTQLFRFLIDQILERSAARYSLYKQGVPLKKLPSYPDKMILLDEKGDYTQNFPSHNFILIAPHDTGLREPHDGSGLYQHGRAWDIAADIEGLPACRDFANSVVEATDEPQWGGGARKIVAGIMYGLQYKHKKLGTRYGWPELRDVALLSDKKLRQFLIENGQKSAAKLVKLDAQGEATRTSASFLINIETGFTDMVISLAAAWENTPRSEYFSFSEWLYDEAPATRSIILQGDKNVEEVSKSWIRAVLGITRKFVSAKNFKEDAKRRVWVLMDEFAQFAAKDDGVLKFNEVGAGKGFCTVYGLQVAKQLDDKWSQSERENLEAMTRTKCIFRTEAGAVAEYLSETWIGLADWEHKTKTETGGGGQAKSRTRGTNQQSEPVVRVNYFADHLGANKSGCSFLLLAGKDLCRLQVPYSTWKEHREPGVMASWVKEVRDFNGAPDIADQAGQGPVAQGATAPMSEEQLRQMKLAAAQFLLTTPSSGVPAARPPAH